MFPLGYARVRRRRPDPPEARRAAAASALILICAAVVVLTSYARRVADGLPLGLSPFADEIAMRLASSRSGGGEEVSNFDLDIDGDGTDEAVVALRDGGGDGRMELYRKTSSGSYQLMAAIDSGPVVDVKLAVLDWNNAHIGGAVAAREPVWRRILVATADYNQSIGAMSRALVNTAYVWDGTHLVQVWQATVTSESVFDTGDETTRKSMLPSVAAKAQGWMRLASVSEHVFTGGSVPQVSVTSTQEVHSYLESDDKFVPLASREVKQVYHWSDKWNAFVIGEAKVGGSGAKGLAFPGSPEGFDIPPGTAVAIMEQERKCAEGLVFNPPYMVRVMLTDGRCCFVEEGHLLAPVTQSMV